MKGLQVWAVANCRSVMAFYESIAKEFGVPLRIMCDDMGSERFKLGWDRDEYSHLDIVQASFDAKKRTEQMMERADWAQWFGAYQSHSLNRRMMVLARKSGCLVGVGSEAPNNYICPSVRSFLKGTNLYRMAVKRRCRGAINAASFIVNYSGDHTTCLQQIGWPVEKIVPFGYYPAKMTGLTFRKRAELDWRDFRLLVTGQMDWRRGQDVVIEAMVLLKKWGYMPHVVMTQTGALYDGIARRVAECRLNVELVGFAKYEDLLKYYVECSAFVAPGRAEPWGMRINDALNAGAPLIVSRGMGGCKIVHDYRCGCTYNSEDAVDLAWQIKSLMDSRDRYLLAVENVAVATHECAPEARAKWLSNVIRERFPEWR